MGPKFGFIILEGESNGGKIGSRFGIRFRILPLGAPVSVAAKIKRGGRPLAQECVVGVVPNQEQQLL